MTEEGNVSKKRRIIVEEEEEDDENDSNPDKYLDDEQPPSDEEEGEDLAENWLADYAPAPELDDYDKTMLAADDDDELFENYETRIRNRLAAEEELDALDARRRERDYQTEMNLERINRFDQNELDAEDEIEEEDVADGAERALNLEAFQCPLREWIAEERTRSEIQRRFQRFLLTYFKGIEDVALWKKRHEHLDPPPKLPSHLKVLPPVYPPKIREMCSMNSSSLEVSYPDLAETQSLLAIWLTDVPKDMLQIFDQVLTGIVYSQFPHYKQIADDLHVRIVNLPLADKLRDLRQGDLNNLIRVSGVVTRRSGVFPVLKKVFYECSSCNAKLGESFAEDRRPSSCAHCRVGTIRIDQSNSVYGNYQKLTLQETPGSVPPGRVPRYKDVILLGDLIDCARPGEEIDVTGIYVHNQHTLSKDKTGFPVFSTVIEANCVVKRHGDSSLFLSDEDRRVIRELGADPQIGARIIRSIAPSIYGHQHVKTAVALSLFGGCAKDGGNAGMHRVRGDINILLLGDPGTAKSQILKYCEKTAPRAVYTTGKGASAVGLTASVHRDPMTKEWTLEGGALVLADQGVCLIDEFDKMSEQDRTSIHEAMEQQTISVSKAGIVTSLQARCAVIAAANPIGGRYDSSFNLAENVDLTDPILQRFDVLCVLQDLVDPVVDEKLAAFVVESHHRSHPDNETNLEEIDNDEDAEKSPRLGLEEETMLGFDEEKGDAGGDGDAGAAAEEEDGPQPLEQQLLRKFISYARASVKPVLHDVDSEKIAALYADLRAQSAISGGVPIAVRHIESIMRMAEASARMHLREHVREDDIDMAIKVVLSSFLQAQKASVRRSLARCFRKYTTYGEESNQLLMHQLQSLTVDAEKYKLITKNTSPVTVVYISALENRAKELNIYDLKPFYSSTLFRNHGFKVRESEGVIEKSYN